MSADKKKQDTKTSVDSLVVDDLVVQLKQLLAGGMSGFCTRFLTQPLDVLKIRFQLQVEPVSGRTQVNSKYTSLKQAINIIYKEEGLRGLWRGHNAGQYMSITYAMTQFWAYERLVHPIRSFPILKDHMYLAEFTAGAAAGVFGSIVSLPFDVVRTRVVAQDPGKGYKNMLTGLVVLARTEGVRGCFRGLVPTVIQIIPMMGGNFMFYDMFIDWYRLVFKQPEGYTPTFVNLICGAAAGGVSKTISYPFDFMKKRVQMKGFESHRKTYGRNQGCSTINQCIRLTIKEEGLLGFYKGLIPTIIKASAATAFYFGLYDLFKHLLI